MKSRWRWRLAVGLLAIGLVIGVRYYLSSHFVVARVTAKLEELYGGTIHVGGAEVGAQHTVLFDVTLFEDTPEAQPWLKVDRLEADLSLKEAIRGTAPSHIIIRGVTITLRFDEEGRVLTALPPRNNKSAASVTQMPIVELLAGKVRLLGQGGRQLTFEDVAMTMKPGLERLNFDGHGRGIQTGEWHADGWVDIEHSQISLAVHSQSEVKVTQHLLEALPFVHARTWQAVQADGATTVAATLTFDLAKGSRSYRVELQPRNASIHVAAIDLAAAEVTGSVVIANNKVALSELQGKAGGGTLSVDGVVNLASRNVDVELTKLLVDNVDLRLLPERWHLPKQLEGRLHAESRLSFSTVAGKVHIEGAGTGEITQARIAGLPPASPVRLALKEVSGSTHLGVELKLAPCEMSIVAEAFDAKLPADIGGRVAMDLALSLPLDSISDPASYLGQGHVTVSDGHIADLALEPVTVGLHVARGELKLVDCRAKLKTGGTMAASASVHLEEPFKFQAKVEPAAMDLKAWPHLLATGRLDATVDIKGTLRPFAYLTEGSAECHDVQTRNWLIHTAALQWHSDAKRIKLDSIQAEAYGGEIHGSGELSLQAGGKGNGKLWLNGLDLGRLVDTRGSSSWAGTVDADLVFELDGADFIPSARGRVMVSDLAFKDQLLAPDCQGDVVLTRQELTVANITATVAQGNVSGKLAVNLKQPERSWFQLDLGNAALADLLIPWPSVAEHAQGTVDIRVRGTLGQEWAGSADVVLQRGKLLGIDVTEWRAPIRWAYHPGEGHGEVELRDSNAQVAQGRVTAQASATWNSGMRLNSQIQFVGVNLHQAFPGSRLGAGRATGRLDISSDRLQTIDDLQANLTATMQHTQALEYPVLRQVAPFLGLTTSKTFQTGEIRARLARSVVHVEKLALAEGPWQLFAEGNVTLQGNVRLDMTASTGKLGNLAAALGWRVPQTGLLGRDQLLRATTALSPQLVHVHVRGTVREPTVQVVPLPLLTEQALRFFAGMQ